MASASWPGWAGGRLGNLRKGAMASARISVWEKAAHPTALTLVLDNLAALVLEFRVSESK